MILIKDFAKLLIGRTNRTYKVEVDEVRKVNGDIAITTVYINSSELVSKYGERHVLGFRPIFIDRDTVGIHLGIYMES